VWVWLMNGTMKLSETYVATVPDTGYQIVKAK
jgi:DNA-binding winged helix-turn-helix (wHTH) protein